MSEQSQNHNKLFTSSKRERIGAAAIVGAALASFLALQGQADYDNPRAVLEAGIWQSCDYVDPIVLNDTSVKLDSPIREGFEPYVAMSAEITDPLKSATYGYSPDKIMNIYNGFELLQTEAAKHNLTIVNPAPYLAAIYQAQSKQGALVAANNYFAEFGIALSVPHETTGKVVDENITLFDIETIKREQLNKILGDFVFSFSHVPKQVVALSHLKKIRLVDSLGPKYNAQKNVKVTTAGVAVYLAHTINIAIETMRFDNDMASEYGFAGTTLLHELGHNIDGSLCGGSIPMDKDPQYNAANKFNGLTYGNAAFAESNNVIEAYGATSLAEDKATIFERLLGYKVATSGESSETLFEKETLLAARIEERVPGYTDYLKTVANGLS